jgi:hypothetical protein
MPSCNVHFDKVLLLEMTQEFGFEKKTLGCQRDRGGFRANKLISEDRGRTVKRNGIVIGSRKDYEETREHQEFDHDA